jgi:YHS domain-containing protein
MKLKFVLSILTAVVLMTGAMAYHAFSQQAAGAGDRKILYYSCPMHPSVKSDKPGSCSICGMSLEPVYGTENTTNNPSSSGTNSAAASNSKPKPYPLGVCVVDGMKLGSMGDPYVFVYKGQEVKMCCPACKADFDKDPAKYMKKIQDAETAKK